MRIGVFGILTDRSTVTLAEIARAAEERGVESLWIGEHSHLPVGSIHPKHGGAPLPDHYARFPDPFLHLASAATVTSTIRIGTGICLVAQHDALMLAKQVATLDQLSGGRFEFGVGYGWNPLEMRNHGVEYTARRAVVREKLAALGRLWTEETASFAGEHVSFTPSQSWPKPVQQPRPPIVVGAEAGARTFADVVDLADGWMPMTIRAADRLPEQLRRLHDACETAGRDPLTVAVSVLDPTPALTDLAPDDFARSCPTADAVDGFARLGAHRLIVGVPFSTRDHTRRALDHLGLLVARTVHSWT
jgi:probable F420-dependent oxidoreductase